MSTRLLKTERVGAIKITRFPRGVEVVLVIVLIKVFFRNLGFIVPCIFTHSNESPNQMQKLITGLLLVV
jgi:hypothetical protein